MKRQISLGQYRAIDLGLMALMLTVFEYIIIRVSTSGMFWDQAYTVSLAAAITSIVYMRWGWWGGIHAALAGLLFCFFYGGRPGQYLTYIIGNLFSLAAVPALKKLGPERVRTGQWSWLLFPLAVILLMQGGRAVMAMAQGAAPMEALGFFTTDALSILFTLVIIWIARRLDGIYEDQKHYLLRIQEEKE